MKDRFGLDPGTEVVVDEEKGRVVVVPEDSPEDIIEDLERQIDETTTGRERATPVPSDPVSRDHVETVQRGAREMGVADTEE